MNLKNCKITIEPKGEPENTVVFFNANCEFDEGFYLHKRAPVVLTLNLLVMEDHTIPDTSINVGYYGQPTNNP